jgi:hypothetical protein
MGVFFFFSFPPIMCQNGGGDGVCVCVCVCVCVSLVPRKEAHHLLCLLQCQLHVIHVCVCVSATYYTPFSPLNLFSL